jgi:glycosyltransferase involved in cell wall biosynthesis
MPRVSVILPTRDRRTSLTRALAGVEAQRFRDFELAVVDDGSVDDTASWLRAKYPTLSLIEVGRSEGSAAARNRGVKHAGGDIIAFLDDDDVWHPAYLEEQVAQLDRHPEADYAVTGHVEVDGAGKIGLPDLRPLYRYGQPLAHLLAECPIHTLSIVACRRTAFDRVGPFDERLTIVHDLDWYTRLVLSGARMERCPNLLVARAIPGGLVIRHREWFAEERMVHRRIFASAKLSRREQQMIRTVRAMLFARIAGAKGDLAFGMRRLAEAVLLSPFDSARIVALKLFWRLPRNAPKLPQAAAWKMT